MAASDAREMPTDIRSRTSDSGWLQTQKDKNSDRERDLADPYAKNEGSKWQFGDDPILKRQLSAVMDKEFASSTASAPHDSPFYLLGDVMPHLRAKARPPPGFEHQSQTQMLQGV
ncbi:hypothetical protein HAX54_039732 [Datura stramonium]|uniref:Uncharacterized protein n=1 Tax=Datura stramonium TaxID=4076 RepID=A0ABS8VN25_DATST|nr:hypothetical protein [Datura stramonium]